MSNPGRGEAGLTVVEILISIMLISAVVVANSAVVRALGLLGITQSTPTRFERPSRLRTLAMEYVAAEMEFLRNQPYDAFRDTGLCASPFSVPVRAGSGTGPAGRVPADGYLSGEPPLPSQFAAADILIGAEPITGAAPNNCGPRRITVVVYATATDAGSGVVFVRGATAVVPR